MIPSGSCHSYEHKKLATNYLTDKLGQCPTSSLGKSTELRTIKEMLKY
jgi:hypothetical protein